MGYARFGVIRSRFMPKGASNNTITGGQFGLGLQTSLMQNWDIRGEYTYSAYSSLTGVAGNPRTDQATLSLVYKFD
jgi:opacity protein-like surface antigen